MRMMINVTFPHEPFNALVRKGKADSTLQTILKDIKAEAVYFTEYDGKRTAVIFVDLAEPSRVPSIAEPFFLKFNADVRFQVVMTADDLGKAGLAKLGKKWA